MTTAEQPASMHEPLDELRREAGELPSEFEDLYREACAAHPTMWSVGGK